jgi:hypothetical protein
VCAPLPRFFTVFKYVFLVYDALDVVPMIHLALLLQEHVWHAWVCKLGYHTELLILLSVRSMVVFQALHLPITLLPEFIASSTPMHSVDSSVGFLSL